MNFYLLSKWNCYFSACENLPNFSCHFWKYKSVFLQILPSNMTPLSFFSWNIICFGQKQPIKVQMFEIFNCSSQSLSTFSCQFRTEKLIALQILHHSSLSWHLTPLQILSSYIFDFAKKDPIKFPILRLSSALLRIYQIPQVIFESTTLFSILYDTSMSWKITPMYLLRSNVIILCTKGINQSANLWDF